MIDYNFGKGPVLMTDSSLTGYGLVLGSDWQAGSYNDSFVPTDWDWKTDVHGHWQNVSKRVVSPRDDNINLLELVPVWLGIGRLVRSYRDVHVVVLSDNTQVVNMLNFGKSSNVSGMCLLREIFWLCAFFNLYVTARHVPGLDNI